MSNKGQYFYNGEFYSRERLLVLAEEHEACAKDCRSQWMAAKYLRLAAAMRAMAGEQGHGDGEALERESSGDNATGGLS